MKVEREYYSNGNIAYETHYNSKKQIHGKYIGWHIDGRLWWENYYLYGELTTKEEGE